MPKFSDVNHIDSADAHVLLAKSVDGLYSLTMAQGLFSFAMFNTPDVRSPAAVLDHVRKEVEEVAIDPMNLQEWADLVILALDGLQRACWLHNRRIPKGSTVLGQAPADVIRDKMRRNFDREWPALAEQDPTRAVEHVRSDVERFEKAVELATAPVSPMPPMANTHATLGMWAQQLREVTPSYGFADVHQLLIAAGLVGPASSGPAAPSAAIPADHVRAFNQLAYFNTIVKIAGYESLPHFLLTALAELGHVVPEATDEGDDR